MKVFLASDHAGFDLKNNLIEFLRAEGHEVDDLGPHTLDMSDDYPDFVAPLAKRVAGEKGSYGIIIGGSGQGEAMVANRTKGVRAAVYYGKEPDILKLSRSHNDANVLSLGARFVSVETIQEDVRAWLATPFSGEERHIRRISKIDG